MIATTAGVSPRARAMEYHGPLFCVGCVHPQGNRKGLVAVKIADLQLNSVVACQLNGLANSARHGTVRRTLDVLKIQIRDAATDIILNGGFVNLCRFE